MTPRVLALVPLLTLLGCPGPTDTTETADPGSDSGSDSATEADPCDPNPCQNGGVCSVADDLAVCDCAGTGFAGDLCEEAVPTAVSINFDDNPTLAVTDSAGSPATVGWNNALGAGPGQGDDGNLTDLLDEAGVATGISVDWTCQDIEITPMSGGTPADQAMMGQGCRSWMGMGDATITLKGLSAHFPSGYTLIAYVGHGGGFPTDHTATFTLNVGADSVMGAVLATFDGSFDPLDGAGDPGNIYVSAHTEDELVLTLAATGAAQLPTAAINGIQLIPAS